MVVDATEEHQLPSGRGVAHMMMRFAKDDKEGGNATIVDRSKDVTRPMREADSGKPVPLAALHCRGLVPVCYYPEDGFRITSTKGTVFEPVDLRDGEWTEYDESLQDTVGVYNLRSEWGRVPK